MNAKQKAADYARLATLQSTTNLLHYLMAFKPSATDNMDETVREEDRDGETACVRAKVYGLGRGDGGLVLLVGWTEGSLTGQGPAAQCGEHVIFAGYVSDMPNGGETYYMNGFGRALREIANKVRAAQRAAA